MVRCLACGKEAAEGKNRNKVEKKFCSDDCRSDYHNSQRAKKFLDELIALLKKYGYLRGMKEIWEDE